MSEIPDLFPMPKIDFKKFWDAQNWVGRGLFDALSLWIKTLAQVYKKEAPLLDIPSLIPSLLF